MSRLALVSALIFAAAGCGKAGFALGGFNLEVVDTGYFSSPDNAFCEAMTNNQVSIVLVDYTPVCQGDPDTTKEHVEIEIVISLGAQPNTANPYEVSKVNCTSGPAAPALVRYKHWAAGAANPDYNAMADSGTIKFTNFDLTGETAAKGTFDVTFEQTNLKGSFESVACN
jgi:hypothetical protein